MRPDDLVGPVVVHAEGTILYANSPFRSLIGTDPATELAGTRLSEVVLPEYREPLTSQFTRVAEETVPALGLEIRVQTPDGPRDVIVVTSPIEWEGRTRLHTTFLTTETDAVRSALPVKEQAMDEAPVGITIADATREDEPLIYVNDGFVELTGYPREEILGRNCRFLQGEDTRDEPVAEMRAAIDAGEPVTVELRNYRKDGSMFWNRVVISPVIDETGAVAYFLGFQEDVTAAKVYEREKTLFETHAERAGQAMFITDRSGTIEYVNPAFEHITGYSADEAIGKTPRILKSDQQDEAFYEDLWETITAGDIWEARITNRTKSGELYEVEQTIIPVTDDRGEITHFASIERDVTDEQFAEQVINVLNRVLRHNLRTSITVIEGYASILEENLETPDQRAAARTIREQTETLRNISEKTKHIRQIVESYDDPSPGRLADVFEVVAECRETHEEATIRLTMEADEDVGVSNGPALEAALREAIENAIVHADTGAPTVDITVAEADAGEIRIDIADTGPGIPDAEWAIIETGHETPLEHSRGLGLWLIYWAMTALGGDVTRADNDPQGTVLRVRIPTKADVG